MNSVVIVNWVDTDFAQRVTYSLEKCGYVRSEDYQCAAAQIQVWEKAAAANARGRFLESDPLAPIRLLPVPLMVNAIKDRLAVYMPEGSKDWEIEHAATNLVYDLMGKPG